MAIKKITKRKTKVLIKKKVRGFLCFHCSHFFFDITADFFVSRSSRCFYRADFLSDCFFVFLFVFIIHFSLP